MAEVVRSESNYLEILPAGITKGDGVADLIASLGYSPDEVVAFGDNQNDREMIKLAGWGVAMGNASDELKRVANYVAPTNGEDGVAHVLELLMGGGPVKG